MEHLIALLKRGIDLKTQDLKAFGKILKVEEQVLKHVAALCDGDG
jgi:hypothetical protein